MKRFLSTPLWSLAVALGLVLGAAVGLTPTAAAQAEPPTPVAVVDAFHAAGADLDAALALLTDDVVLKLVPPPPNTPGVWTGKEEARAFFAFKNAQNVTRERVGEAHVIGNQVSGRVNTSSNRFRLLGVGAVGHTFDALVQDGKIKSYTGTILPEELIRVNAAVAAQVAAAAPAPAPGMPATGAPVILLPLILAGGLLLLLAGTVLRRRKA
jgi:hypothetical protein